MSISEQIDRIRTEKNRIKDKLIELGISTSDANLNKLATDIEGIVNRGAVLLEVMEGNQIVIPAGYHNGNGIVIATSDVEGDLEKFKLQIKENIVPTKNDLTIVADNGYYGLKKVHIKPIPDAYQDVSQVNATSDDVLPGKVFVDSSGNVVAGTMKVIDAEFTKLGIGNTSKKIEAGYHSGNGEVQIELEAKEATPNKTEQIIRPESGKVLSQVIVKSIPENYITTDDATATSDKILQDATAYVNGEKLYGSMPDNSLTAATLSLDGMKTNEISIPVGYHNGKGKVILTSSIEEALAAI